MLNGLDATRAVLDLDKRQYRSDKICDFERLRRLTFVSFPHLGFLHIIILLTLR